MRPASRRTAVGFRSAPLPLLAALAASPAFLLSRDAASAPDPAGTVVLTPPGNAAGVGGVGGRSAGVGASGAAAAATGAGGAMAPGVATTSPAAEATPRWTDATPDAMIAVEKARALRHGASEREVLAAIAVIGELSPRATYGLSIAALEEIA